MRERTRVPVPRVQIPVVSKRLPPATVVTLRAKLSSMVLPINPIKVTLVGRSSAKFVARVAVIVFWVEVNGLDCPMARAVKNLGSTVRGCNDVVVGLSIVHLGTGFKHEPAFRAQIMMRGARCACSGFVSLNLKVLVVPAVIPALATFR